MNSNPLKISVYVALSILGMSGCSSYWDKRQAHALIRQGEYNQGLGTLQKVAKDDPEKYKYGYIQERDKILQNLLHNAHKARDSGYFEQGRLFYNEIIKIDPQYDEAYRGLRLLEQQETEYLQLVAIQKAIEENRKEDAFIDLSRLVEQNPNHLVAKQLLSQLKQQSNTSVSEEARLDVVFKKPISLALSDVDVRSVFELLSQSSGLNFIFDQDVKPDIRTTIYAKDTSIEDALKLILKTSQLKMKVLNSSTLLIYQDVDEKKKQYEELIVKTFYLKNTEPKKMMDMIKALITPKYIYTDDALKLIVVRDNNETIQVIQKLVDSYDLVDPEVLLEVEVLEISNVNSSDLGLRVPDQVTLGLTGATTGLTIDQLQNLNSSNYPLFFPNPLAVLNLKQTSGKTKTLANPRIRVTNQKKAKILIGDKVPVITTTVNQTSSASTESINYLDVGLSLSVQPTIHIDDQVTIAIDLEVSNIAQEVRSTTGLLTYQIGTRNASTVLRLKNGETQVLAGLIKNDETSSASHVPGIGKIPLLGKLFSDETKKNSHSEIVLLITPHIIRNLESPILMDTKFVSGTNNDVTPIPLRLTDSANYSLTKQSNSSSMADPMQNPEVGINSSSSIQFPQTINTAPLQRQVSPSLSNGNSIDPSLLAPSIKQP